MRPEMSSQDSIQTSSASSVSRVSPHEEALQSLCKTLLKSRLFRGYYKERRYVEMVGGYRDIVALQRDERELEKLLLDMLQKLQLFYQYQVSKLWVGISYGKELDTAWQSGALDTCVWAELADLAFGQYWFSIKSVRFRDNEILLKLKMVRPVEDTVPELWQRRHTSPTYTAMVRALAEKHAALYNSTDEGSATTLLDKRRSSTTTTQAPETIGIQDFAEVVNQWGISIKHSVYDFMSNDVSKDNIKSVLRFFGLLIVSLLSGCVVAIKFLGAFTLRFMFEFSRITHALTPIVLKMIEVLNKIVGGFFILLAMIWRDMFGKRIVSNPEANFREIEYNRPLYKSIQYDVRQQAQRGGVHTKRSTEFERKFQ